MQIIINSNTKIKSEMSSNPVQHAISDLNRDIDRLCKKTDNVGSAIELEKVKEIWEHGCFRITTRLVSKEQNENYVGKMVIQAVDELGFVYGLYHISKVVLGVHEFWFWNDQTFVQQEAYVLEDGYEYASEPFAVKLRGWFVNDEVLLHKWYLDRDKHKPWEMVFESLLRCGGNMIIPGTDKNSVTYRKMASDRGLYISHHHAEPLGAEMFSRAYPELNPSYDEHPDKFHKLWEEGIRRQQDLNVVWNLGFRGQGDCPFWASDPRYNTNESRGELMGQLIEKQYKLVKSIRPEAICCTNLYGETMELYSGGYLKLPEDIIKIWADNGYGKMVSRRQENHNPRIVALPNEGDKGSHGIYYHVSFYDLQAANHMTLLPNSPEFVSNELKSVLENDIDDYWIVNCSNIKPHVYYLDFISKIWQEGDVDINAHRMAYAVAYYGSENAQKVSESLVDYHKNAVAYGIHEDEHAGEQFVNHVPRMLISQYMKDRSIGQEHLLWATAGGDLMAQVGWYQEICSKAAKGYGTYLKTCEMTAASMDGAHQELYKDTMLLQAKMLDGCYSGAYEATVSLKHAFGGDYLKAFYHAGRAKELYEAANKAMRNREHGKWHLFYENECLTDIKQTAYVLTGLMSYLRNMGDGPHFYKWQREFLYSEDDRQVMLILNMENHLRDEELFALMKARWDK